MIFWVFFFNLTSLMSSSSSSWSPMLSTPAPFVHYNHIHPSLILYLPFRTMELGNLCFWVRLMTIKDIFSKLVTRSWNHLAYRKIQGRWTELPSQSRRAGFSYCGDLPWPCALSSGPNGSLAIKWQITFEVSLSLSESRVQQGKSINPKVL